MAVTASHTADLVSSMSRGELEELVGKMIEAKDPRDPNLVTLVACSGDLDKIWPTTILASTAAAGGMDVAVFFTFWGLFSLVKEDRRVTGDNWMTRGLSLMNRPSAEHAALSKLNMGGAGPMMMRKLAKQHGVAAPEELMEMAKDLDVKMWPCQMTMDLMGLKREDMIDGLDEPAGAATALARMQKSAISLFI
ncbi:DsrE/DsrF/DrsH-like family protein [Paraconexibacter antarcticus]|uniref:DsrE/DsrF/DrsH-like family protein n=1 Tax=Paraconexibacter antarcticus TaxID=2949664 RepID=A0ABY5E134_9ACTN|nr:DsrE/DsrF/DrsH-like family protein [Paraconexibacter antarcticus]UTI66872.1 DsrE/DsrF/DrsH-like family protein [Paraconexibacter antarcticus]